MASRIKEYDPTALAALLQTETPALVQFGTDWCAPCKRQERVLTELSETWSERIHIGKVNVEDWPDLAKAHQVTKNPTLCLFISGRIQKRHEGYLDAGSLQRYLETE